MKVFCYDKIQVKNDKTFEKFPIRAFRVLLVLLTFVMTS